MDPVRIPRGEGRDLDKRLADAGVLEQLRRGNVFEVLKNLPTDITREDIEQFMRDERRRLAGNVIQDYEIKSSYADYHGVDPALFPEHQAAMTIAPSDAEVMSFGAGKGITAKAMGVTKSSEGNAALTQDDLRTMSEETLQELDQFLVEVADHMLDSQMMSQMKQKDTELKAELQRIISLAKSGRIHPVFIVIALAKTYVSQQGILFSFKGRKLGNMNEAMNRISRDLQGASNADYATIQAFQNRTREGGMQMQFVTQDLQKISGNIESTLSTVKSIADLIFRAQDEVIRKVSA